MKEIVMLLAFTENSYSFKVPPVCTNGWNKGTWVNWVYNTGIFYNLEQYSRRVNQIHINAFWQEDDVYQQ